MANEKDPAAPATPPDPNQPDPQPKHMTVDDFNGAMTARERRFEQRIAKMLEERFATIAPAKTEPVIDDGGAKHAEPDPATKQALAKLEAMQRQMAAEKEMSAKKEAEMLAKQERSEAFAALTEAGSHNAKGAYALLRDDGRIKRNADGDLVVILTRDYAGTKIEEEVPLADGIKAWLATDEGKHYLPPRGGGEGSGTVVRGGGGRNSASMSKEERKREAQNMLTGFILNK